jgi:two-component system LytT family response regulator
MPERLQVLIADDEQPARARLRRMLADIDGVELAGEAADGATCVAAIARLEPDVVLLDVQMPNGTGFDVIEQVGPEAMPAVIFVTAYDEHAVKAFDVRALDYLLKPVLPERLAEALGRARERVTTAHDVAARLHSLVEQVAPRPHLTRILVDTGERAVLLPVERISWIQADRNNVWLHSGGKALLLHESIAALESRLDPERFLRVNRSVIVRLEAVVELQPWSHGEYRIKLDDGTTTPWTRRYRAQNAGRFSVGSGGQGA